LVLFRQWGYLKINATPSIVIPLVIAIDVAYVALAGDGGEGAYSLGSSANKTDIAIHQKATQQEIPPIIEGWWICIGAVNAG